jgi:hypothetical protein
VKVVVAVLVILKQFKVVSIINLGFLHMTVDAS